MDTSTPSIPYITVFPKQTEEDTLIIPEELTIETQDRSDITAAGGVPNIKVRPLGDLQGQQVDEDSIKRKDTKGNVIRLIGLDGLITIQVVEGAECFTETDQQWGGLDNNTQYDENSCLNNKNTVLNDPQADVKKNEQLNKNQRKRGTTKQNYSNLLDDGESKYNQKNKKGQRSKEIHSTFKELVVEEVNAVTGNIFYDDTVDPFGENNVDVIPENHFDLSNCENSPLIKFGDNIHESVSSNETINNNIFGSKDLKIIHCSDVESDGNNGLRSNNSTVGSENSQAVLCFDPFGVEHVTFVDCNESVGSKNFQIVQCSDPLGDVEYMTFDESDGNGLKSTKTFEKIYKNSTEESENSQMVNCSNPLSCAEHITLDECDNNGLKSGNNFETIYKTSTELSENSQIVHCPNTVEYNTLYGSEVFEKGEHEPPNTDLKEMEIVKTAQNFDEAGLKAGIIEVSRTLIDTQKNLKILTQFFSGGDKQILKRRRAIRLITKVQRTLKSFQRSMDGIDKSVKNQYSHLFPKTDIDSFLESIKRVESVKVQSMRKKMKEKLLQKGCAYKIVSSDKLTGASVNFDNSSNETCNKRLSADCVNVSKGDKLIMDSQRSDLEYMEVNKCKKSRFRRVQPGSKSEVQQRKKRKYVKKKDKLVDKTFPYAHLTAFENTLPKRYLPTRSCRKEQYYDLEEEDIDES